MRWALLLMMAVGCRQVFGLDSPEPTRDAASDGVVDGPRDAQGGTCMQRWIDGPQFAAPVQLGGINTTSQERGPFLLDNSHLYFVRENDIYVANASANPFEFSTAMKVEGLSSMSSDDRVFVNTNQTRAFFSSNRSGTTGATDLFRGARGDLSEQWVVDQMFLGNLNGSSDQTNPYLSGDLLHIYYGQKGTGIMYAERTNVSDPFAGPRALTELGTENEDDTPTLTADETVIVFTSRRTGSAELWYATRSPTVPGFFSAPKLVPGLNIPTRSDEGPFITSDGCQLYFASDRNGTSHDLFVATLLD